MWCSMCIMFFFGLLIDSLLIVRLWKLSFVRFVSDLLCRFLNILFWMILNSVFGLLSWLNLLSECFV